MIDWDDNASVSTDAVSQASSSSSSLFTFQADRHSTAISRLGRAQSVADQLQDLAHQDSTADLAELHKIFEGKETFVLETSTKRPKKRSKLTRGRSGARNHLRRDHCLLLKAGGDGGDGETTSESIESEPPRKRQRTLEDSFKNKPVVSKAIDKVFREALLGWIASADLPFTAVEHPDFINLLRHLNAKLVNELLPQSGDTIKAWMKLEYGAMKEELKCQLALSPYKKLVTFELWTSPYSYALLGVNPHFADLTGKLCSELLSLKHVYGAHTGDNIGVLLRAVIADFEISDTLGYTVSDNAKNNDDAVTKLLELTLPDEEPAPRRLRCGNHIINLSATTFQRWQAPQDPRTPPRRL
ncbi:uncharacterized protein FRV6_16746 [Fusarium oxysporum]|uniref:Uncharacterized protein n=1 Tax=Fusarium oxysporum TaxID=5507 RepID=A0A2H3TVH8_FUSOX|nr:uncharacterized protein FRV6_16746 [Fusarium oxysporum]